MVLTKVGFLFVVSAVVLVSFGFVVCFFRVRRMSEELEEVEQHCLTTTPNPCLEYRDARYLSDDCGNHSSTGYCAQSNSACLPSEDGLDWTCRCIHSHYNHNSSCVPVPSSLFEHKVMALGSLKSDRIVSLSQEDTNNSEHLFEFGDAVEDVNNNSSNCVIRTFNAGFSCTLNSSGIIVGVNKVLDSALYHVIVHVTLQVGSENAEVEDTLSILFEVQATQQNQTILIAEGTLKDTLITTVDLKVNDTNPSLQGNAHFLSMDSNGLVKTNQTTLLDTDFVSQMFTAIVYDNIFLNIVVYKLSHQISINENTNATVICKTDPMVNSAILQTGNYKNLLLLPDGSIVVNVPFDYEMIKEYTFDLFGQVDDKNFTIKIALNILDVNDNPPVLDNNYMFTVTNSQLRVIVGVVPATDPDTVGVLNYSITDEGGDSRFQIGSFGEVSMVNTSWGGNATVTVTDGVFYVNASVTVNVVSAETNDTHQQFNVSNCVIFENKDKGTSLCSVFKNGYVDYAFDPLSDRTKFNLNSTTGNLTTNAPLDREDIDHYDYSVIAIQSKNPCKFATIRVKISVLDENDETPMFDQPVYRGKIRENANGAKVTLETPLKVMDRDLNSTFTFNISGTTFTISSTGEIFTSDETIDRETQSSYSLTVMVSDEKHANSSIVEISVEDENDNRPMALNMTFSVLEDAAEDTVIGQVIATDADIGINAQLIFTDASSGYFEVNTTGFLKVSRLLDRETKDKDVFTVSVCDSGRDISLCTRSWITVNITDVNEAPRFIYNKEVPRIPENSNCLSISDLTEFFVDGDLGVNRELDFSVLSESDTFHIDSNGKLSCPGLDYDDSLNKVYELTIKATDRGDPPLSTNGTIIIVVEDVNDNAPIPSDDTNFEIVFYSGGCQRCSKLVALITATDKDSGSNGEIEFQEIRGNASTFLEIDNSTGLIEASTNDTSLANGTYLYIVNITDKGTPSRGTTVTLSFNVAVLMNTQISRIFVKDKLIFNWTENDAFPSPFIPVKNFTINPAMSIEKFVLPNYNLGDFYLNGSEQEFLYVNRTKHSTFFDRETQQQYRFIIQAKLPLYSMLAELTINIIDVNDNPPRFQSDIAQVALIKENDTNGTSLNRTFVATDRDEGENAQIAYKISNENCDDVFQLSNSDSGNIVLIGKLDYEDKEYCNLTLTVFNPNNETMQSSVDVHIEIVDVNDNSPLFDQSVYHVSIKESVKDVEEEVLVYINGLNVTDRDSRQFGKKSVRISIERPSECPLIVREHKVDNFVLMINQSMTLDYESTINFNCTLRATDGGNLSSTALLEIELLDINDNSPEADDVIEREIPRSSEIDYVIVSQINATDRDSGRNALLSFEFNTTNNNADGRYSYFEINDTNGKISIAKNLTTLQLDSVELTVTVSDDGLPQRLSTLVMVKINITDDNERPIFSRAEYREEVVENSKLEGVLMTVTAQDRKNEKLVECNCTYRLIDISDSHGSYTIEDVTGNLTVNVSGYDREKEPFITMTVVARDEGGKETSARVNITVLDQNDNDPKFLEDFQFEVYQEAPVGTCFGMVTAEDKDEGMNAVTLYKIIRDSITSSNYNDSVIVIEETTGELCSNESLNIGAVRDFTEHVRVEAIDKGDRNRRNRVTVSVIIKYKDTNQHHPNITLVKQGDIEPISLKSRQSNIPVTSLSANDPDEGKDGEVEFSILEGNVLDMFTIDRDTGDLSFSSKITMIGSHPVYLTVQATDKGVHPKSSTLTLNLTLEGEKESYIADKVKSAEEFMTYTWSLVGVACFLILVTAAAVFGFCQSRIKAHRELDDDHRRTFNGLKHNVSYGVNMPQMHMLQQDWTGTNAQRRTRFRSDSTSFESSLDRYPPERDGPEEFDQRRSFKISVFDPSPERHAPAPQLPPPRESSGPLIPKPDYD